MHLKNDKFFCFFVAFGGQKHISGTCRATNEQVNKKAPIPLLKAQFFAVYGVEHQKTSNTKLVKQTIWFLEAIKGFYHYFPEKEIGKHKKL